MGIIFGYGPDEVQAMGRIDRLLGDHRLDRTELRPTLPAISADRVSLQQIVLKPVVETHGGASGARISAAAARRSA